MGGPTTFKRHGRHFVTIMDAKHGRTLTEAQTQYCALTLAMHYGKHSEAVASIVAHGLAVDAAEADDLIYQAESLQAEGRL